MDIVFITGSSNSVTLILRSRNEKTTRIMTYDTGYQSRPIFVITSDINNDQSMDFLVALYMDSTISIYLNDGNGSFYDPIRIELDNQYPNFIALGDLNGDDRLDIVFVSSFSSTVGIILANDDGSFTDVILYSTGRQAFPLAVTLGHFNNNTFLDIAIVNGQEGTIYILIGYGNGTFGESHIFPAEYLSFPSWITLTYLNHDKQDDILICTEEGYSIGVFLIHPEADFTKEKTYLSAAEPHPSSIVIADFNGDDRLDVAVANSGNDNVQMFLDYSMSTFSEKITYSSDVGSHPQYVTVAHFNNDDHFDLAIAYTWIDNIHILLGRGSMLIIGQILLWQIKIQIRFTCFWVLIIRLLTSKRYVSQVPTHILGMLPLVISTMTTGVILPWQILIVMQFIFFWDMEMVHSKIRCLILRVLYQHRHL